VTEPATVGGVIRWIAAHPWEAIAKRWNYKAAMLSALIRATLFFCANLAAGLDAAASAAVTEIVFRLATAGFYGALTQAFRNARPRATATLCVMVLLPAVAHSLELVVHWTRGTAELATSIGASIVFTAVSTAFNLFAMRHGALIVGHQRQSVLADLAAMPRLAALFVASMIRTCARPGL
jgi:hypothetical protein